MNPEKREYDLAGLLSLIQLESELTIAVASLNVFGSLPEVQSLHLVAGWAGYEYTLYGLAPGRGIQQLTQKWPCRFVIWLPALTIRTGKTAVCRPDMR
ncbi:Uncharacterised protein [Citrobacter amalonaticus]|nr:Uncharacterised protein [Citrobacter amalonaticus]